MSFDFDLFVIGGGSGGIATARRAAEYGAKVGLAEFDRLGGTCVNRGCIPKKLMVYTSHFPSILEESQGYGWSPVKSTLDWSKMVKSINGEVDRLNGIYQKMLDKSNVRVYRTYGRLLGPHTVEVGDTEVTADKILIAVGGRPIKPDIPGKEYLVTSNAMFELPKKPKRVVIWGGGYIGVEFACIMHGLGSDVIQIIRRDKILKGFDEDLRSAIQESMLEHGIRILNNCSISGVKKTNQGLTVSLEGDSNNDMVLTDAIGLAATGRIPNLDNLGLENTGVEVQNGIIIVDKYSQTAEPNIYAVGDCTDRINLTPVAIGEGRAFADAKFGGKSCTMSYENIPSAVFSTPEAATVGLTEAQAKKQYGESTIKVYRSKFRPMYYVLSGKEEKTFMKLVVHKESDRVLGAHMVGDHAAEIIQGVAIAVKMGATKADFDTTIGIHPSSAEEFVTMR
ncbi:glutathione-disulfide reductase [Cyanobacterium sp. uoEpiScrs1]|uniref:glutathione-disulfide reductase n=1 Tax=Cyanobacterium sp. uoEpiScrs1 TaxID=2976343 RepID=UPI00226A103A|nr:glutathione-disulfide reductase [Cyanobacterium sp. uoEpiScrs1]